MAVDSVSEAKLPRIGPRILYVDDDILLLREFSSAMRDFGLDVVSASSFDIAKELISVEAFDVLVSDLRLPVVQVMQGNSVYAGAEAGIELARLSRSKCSHISVVLVSGFDSPSAKEWCRRNDALFIRKERLDEEEILRKLRDLAAQSRRQRVVRLQSILQRIGPLARLLSARRSERAAYELKNEYDLQELLECLLSYEGVSFIREEVVPSVGGVASRVDFWLEHLRVALEIKFTRKRLSEKKLHQQLIDDLIKYRGVYGCDVVAFYIYDAANVVRNSAGFVSAVGKLSSQDVEVVVEIFG